MNYVLLFPQIGDFIVLKSEASDPRAALWRVDGKSNLFKLRTGIFVTEIKVKGIVSFENSICFFWCRWIDKYFLDLFILSVFQNIIVFM
jgi:hypothetical protein